MTVTLDPDWLPAEALYRIAETVRLSHDIRLPDLPNWNDGACARHGGIGLDPVPGCQRCGVIPRRHQRIGITWLWLTKRAGLFDSTGLGKTVQIAGLLALMLADGKLDDRRALIIVRAATIGQWQAELSRMIPSLQTVAVTGNARERGAKLARPWQAAIVGPEMLVSKVSKGLAQLRQFDLGTVVCDDIDALKNENKTSKVVQRLCGQADRVVIATATPLDKRLTQLYDLGTMLDWGAVLGSKEAFLHRYVDMQQSWYTPKLKPVMCKACRAWLRPDYKQRAWVDQAGRRGPCPRQPGHAHFPLSRMKPEAKCTWVDKGPVQANLPEFRARIAPLVLRRTAADCDDIAMPDCEPSQVWLDLGAGQRARYDEIRKGILSRVNEVGELSRAEAQNWWMRAWQCVSSLANFDSGISGESVKLDWVVDALTGDLSDEPVVVYCHFRATLADLSYRLDKAGVGNARIWGEQRAGEQDAAIRAFNSGQRRVMLITSAGGMGLNLQRSRRVILVDTPRSAARVQQIIGRVRRDGSVHETCYVTQLFATVALERELSAMISREAMMSAAVLDDGQLGDEFAGEPSDILQSLVSG